LEEQKGLESPKDRNSCHDCMNASPVRPAVKVSESGLIWPVAGSCGSVIAPWLPCLGSAGELLRPYLRQGALGSSTTSVCPPGCREGQRIRPPRSRHRGRAGP